MARLTNQPKQAGSSSKQWPNHYDWDMNRDNTYSLKTCQHLTTNSLLYIIQVHLYNRKWITCSQCDFNSLMGKYYFWVNKGYLPTRQPVSGEWKVTTLSCIPLFFMFYVLYAFLPSCSSLKLFFRQAGAAPFASTLINDYFDVRHRAFAMGVFNSGIYVGMGLAFASWARRRDEMTNKEKVTWIERR